MTTATIDKPKKKRETPAGVQQYGTLADDLDTVNVIYYGEPGSGKTSALAGLSRLGKVHYFEAESGLKAKPLRKLGVEVDNIIVHRDITYEDIEEQLLELRAELDSNPHAFVGVVFDSLTEIQKALLGNIVERGVKKAENKGIERGRHEIYKEDWGAITEQMRHLVRITRDLPCHVGLACLERRDEDDDGAITYRPALTPALGGDVAGYMDLGCYTTERVIKGQRFYVGTFRRGPKFWAKDRYSMMPTQLIDPSFDRIVAYIQEELTENQDERQIAWKQTKEAAKTKTA